MIKISLQEKLEDRKRNKRSLILTLIIYLILLLMLGIFSLFHSRDEESVVVKVQLHDLVQQEIKEKQREDEAQRIKKEIRKKQKERKKLLKQKEKLEEKIQKNENNQPAEEKRPIQKETQKKIEKDMTQDVIKKDNTDLMAEYQKEQDEKRRQQEEAFFKEKSSEQEKLDKIEKQLAELSDKEQDDLENLDTLFEQDGKETPLDDQSTVKGDSNIQWDGEKGRRLVYKTPITLTDEYRKEGLKTSLRLKFTVLNNGMIGKVEIIESTGFSYADQFVIDQFKKWRFEENLDESKAVSGEIPINIQY